MQPYLRLQHYKGRLHLQRQGHILLLVRSRLADKRLSGHSEPNRSSNQSYPFKWIVDIHLRQHRFVLGCYLGHANSDSNRHTDLDANFNCNPYEHSNLYLDINGDTNSHSHQYVDGNCEPDGHAYLDGNIHRYSDKHPNSYTLRPGLQRQLQRRPRQTPQQIPQRRRQPALRRILQLKRRLTP